MKSFIKKLVSEKLILFYHKAVAWLGALLYGFPSRKMIVIGITGTKGKTSTASFLFSCLKAAGYKWAPKKMMWYYHSGERRSFSRGKYSIDDIRTMHGSKSVQVKGFQRVEAA